MVWKTLAEALESALALQMDKGTGTEAPAKSKGRNNSQETEGLNMTTSANRTHTGAAPPMGRQRYTGVVSPNAAKGNPARPVYLCLAIDNGGGGVRAGGGIRPDAYRSSPGGNRASNSVKLVWSA